MVSALSLLLLLQVPSECVGVHNLRPGPFCFFATYVDHLALMASAFQHEGDSVAAAGAGTDLEGVIETALYWQMERRRISTRACRELSAFRTQGDSLADQISKTFCLVVRAMAQGDSTALEDELAALRETSPRQIGDQATKRAARRQEAEQLNRLFAATSLGFTHLLTRIDPDTGRVGLLAVSAVQRRWLIDHLRAIPQDAGVFGQVASKLSDWLADPGWRTSRQAGL